MPGKDVISRAKRDAKQGKAPSTQAGEFVREEIRHVRERVHGAQSVKQAIAIGLSKARRAGIKLPPPKKGRASAKIRHQAQRDLVVGRRRAHATSRTRSRAVLKALRRKSSASTSHRALSRQKTNES
jgi:hypothetical protein